MSESSRAGGSIPERQAAEAPLARNTVAITTTESSASSATPEPAVKVVGGSGTVHSDRFYIPQLDGLRFVAFLLVFWHHQPSDLMLFPVSAVRMVLVRGNTFGWAGVDLFFCLSSFLISSLLLREQSLTGDISLGRFYIRRALRIWPLYFLVLTLVFLIFPLFGFLGPTFGTEAYGVLIRQHLFPFLVFLGNFSYAYFPQSLTFLLAPLWSVSVEEQFYLLWPVLIAALARTRRHLLVLVLIAITVVTILTRVYIVANAIPYPMLWVNTLGRLDPFVLGTAVALIYADGRYKVPPLWSFMAAAGLILLAVMFPQIGASVHSIWQLSAIALGWGAALFAVIGGRVGLWLLGNRVLRWAGKLSYGFYVFHRIGIAVSDRIHHVTAAFGTLRFAIESTVHMSVALLITIGISAVSYYAFERWFLLLKARFTIIESRSV